MKGSRQLSVVRVARSGLGQVCDHSENSARETSHARASPSTTRHRQPASPLILHPHPPPISRSLAFSLLRFSRSLAAFPCRCLGRLGQPSKAHHNSTANRRQGPSSDCQRARSLSRPLNSRRRSCSRRTDPLRTFSLLNSSLTRKRSRSNTHRSGPSPNQHRSRSSLKRHSTTLPGARMGCLELLGE